MPFRIISEVSNKAWGDVDKSSIWQRLKRGLEEGASGVAEAVREVYTVIKAPINAELTQADCWGPHHEVREDGAVVLNRNGVIAAAQALAGARSEPNLTSEQRASARRHIARHYRQLNMELPEGLQDAADAGVQRWDAAEITEFKRDSNGYLKVKLALVKPGVFPYSYADGRTRMEFKPPEEVFSSSVLETVQHAPVTDEHPEELVTPANARQYLRGVSLDNARVQDGRVMVDAIIYDEALAEAVISGTKREVSLGFITDLVEEPGEWQGQHYDARQTNIRVNHIAMVPKGRCGPDCSARFDGAYMVIQEQESGRSDGNVEKKVTIGRTEYTIDAAVADYIAKLEEDNRNLKTRADELQGKLDAKEDAVKALESKLEQVKKDAANPQELDKLIEARVVLIDAVRRHVPEFDPKGKSERDIKVALIQAVSPDFKADGKSDEYIQARFDGALEILEKVGSGSVGPANLRFPKADNSAIAELRKKRLEMRKEA